MKGLIIFLSFYFVFFIFIIYIFICGSSQKHRNDFIGKIYIFITVNLPYFCFQCCISCLPKKLQKKARNYEDSNFFNYVVAVFFVFIYLYFSLIYIKTCLPKVDEYMEDPSSHKKILYTLAVIPWIFVLLVHFSNPGVINKYNVEEYLQIYPYDHVIYTEGTCPTEHIPIVARSRYDRFTERRIA